MSEHSLFDRSGIPLIPLPASLGMADIIATLLGQSSEYWAGNGSVARDANPLVRRALEVSPMLSLPAAMGWIVLIGLAMTSLPRRWRQRVYLFLCIAHLVFVWGWVLRWSFVWGLLFSIVAAFVGLLMVRQIQKDRECDAV